MEMLRTCVACPSDEGEDEEEDKQDRVFFYVNPLIDTVFVRFPIYRAPHFYQRLRLAINLNPLMAFEKITGVNYMASFAEKIEWESTCKSTPYFKVTPVTRGNNQLLVAGARHMKLGCSIAPSGDGFYNATTCPESDQPMCRI